MSPALSGPRGTLQQRPLPAKGIKTVYKNYGNLTRAEAKFYIKRIVIFIPAVFGFTDGSFRKAELEILFRCVKIIKSEGIRDEKNTDEDYAYGYGGNAGGFHH